MNLFDLVKHIPHGAATIAEWLGSGGEVVGADISQRRSDICNGDNPSGKRCEQNVHSDPVTSVIAFAIKRHLEVKNSAGLRVKGEKMLGSCAVCSCVLRLQIHEPQDRVTAGMTADEKDRYPAWCWKVKPIV